MNKKNKTEQQTQEIKNAECEKAVSLRHGLGATLRLCKDCIHVINISSDTERKVYWCNRKHKTDLVTGEPELTPCYHERVKSLFKCGEKAKYFVRKQEQ